MSEKESEGVSKGKTKSDFKSLREIEIEETKRIREEILDTIGHTKEYGIENVDLDIKRHQSKQDRTRITRHLNIIYGGTLFEGDIADIEEIVDDSLDYISASYDGNIELTFTTLEKIVAHRQNEDEVE